MPGRVIDEFFHKVWVPVLNEKLGQSKINGERLVNDCVDACLKRLVRDHYLCKRLLFNQWWGQNWLDEAGYYLSWIFSKVTIINRAREISNCHKFLIELLGPNASLERSLTTTMKDDGNNVFKQLTHLVTQLEKRGYSANSASQNAIKAYGFLYLTVIDDKGDCLLRAKVPEEMSIADILRCWPGSYDYTVAPDSWARRIIEESNKPYANYRSCGLHPLDYLKECNNPEETQKRPSLNAIEDIAYLAKAVEKRRRIAAQTQQMVTAEKLYCDIWQEIRTKNKKAFPGYKSFDQFASSNEGMRIMKTLRLDTTDQSTPDALGDVYPATQHVASQTDSVLSDSYQSDCGGTHRMAGGVAVEEAHLSKRFRDFYRAGTWTHLEYSMLLNIMLLEYSNADEARKKLKGQQLLKNWLKTDLKYSALAQNERFNALWCNLQREMTLHFLLPGLLADGHINETEQCMMQQAVTSSLTLAELQATFTTDNFLVKRHLKAQGMEFNPFWQSFVRRYKQYVLIPVLRTTGKISLNEEYAFKTAVIKTLSLDAAESYLAVDKGLLERLQNANQEMAVFWSALINKNSRFCQQGNEIIPST